jgi:hypothetical protein
MNKIKVAIAALLIAASSPVMSQPVDQAWYAVGVTHSPVGKLRIGAIYEGWYDIDKNEYAYQEINLLTAHPLPNNYGTAQILFRQFSRDSAWLGTDDTDLVMIPGWSKTFNAGAVSISPRVWMHINDSNKNMYRGRIRLGYKMFHASSEAFMKDDETHLENRHQLGVSHKIGRMAMSLEYVLRDLKKNQNTTDALYLSAIYHF